MKACVDFLSSSSIKINGPNQERAYDLLKCMRHIEFREELVEFFIKQWSSSDNLAIIDRKRIFVSFGDTCHLFSYEAVKTLQSFQNNHIEVESRMVFHLSKIRARDILIRTPKHEKMLVYLIYHIHKWDTNLDGDTNNKQIWLEIGDSNKGTLEQINVNEIHKSLTHNMVNALSAWYIFTGCEYEPSFHGKGRKTCFKHFEKSTEYQVAFANIGVHEPSERDIQMIERYTCQLYNLTCDEVNDGRVKMFQNAYTTKKGIDFSKKGKLNNHSNITL